MGEPSIPAELGRAREQFLALVAEVRPELHRYCARIVGSAVQGEDIVQETLAKAFYAMSMATDVPKLRPWLFRVAHNTSIDFLRRYDQRNVEVRSDLDDVGDVEVPVGPEITRAALSSFLHLPVQQRSAVILKDVLGHSIAETADTMATTELAVKAALVRGRARLRAAQAEESSPQSATPIDLAARQKLDRWAALFNARDWEGLRALVGEECRLDLVGRASRRGKQVGEYFGNYARLDVRLVTGSVEGRPALLVFESGSERPAYFIELAWDGDRVGFIRDYRYSEYIVDELEYALG